MDNSNLAVNQRTFVAGIFELLLGVVAVGLGMWVGPNPHATMPRIYEGTRFFEGILDGFLVGMLLVYIVIWLERLDLSWVRHASSLSERMFLQLMQGANFWHFLAVSLAAGVGEELLFRGWLQSFLELHLASLGAVAPWIAILISSAVFGIVHPISKGYIVLVFLLGCILGVAYHATGNIMVPIIAHALYDLLLMMRMGSQLRKRDKAS